MAEGTNNKRVAKNTILLYCRMLFTMVVSLYTSRVILSTLGVVDYGIHNVVGGVVTMFSFLNASMTTSTQRYLTFELGKGDGEKLKKAFSMSLTIHFAIGVLVLLLCETFGLWFLNNKLVIPETRLFAANCVFQLSLLSFFFNIIQVPYNAALVAHERMNVYAYVSIVDVVLKLLIVYVLVIITFDKLIVYSFLFFLLSCLIRFIYQIYCKKHFEECTYHLVKDKSLFKEMFGFAGWNLFGSIAWMLRDQGVNILLNIFMGPAVNAARGVALQVSNAVKGFSSNFTVAINPQITKNYAAGNLIEMETLVYRSSKFSFFLLFFIAFPLMLNINFVMGVWLKDVPNYSPLFVILILVDALINVVFSDPFITSLMATGKIRNYQIVVSSILLFIVPVGFVALKMGGDAPVVFYIMIFFTFLSGIARYSFCVKQIGFQWRMLLKNALKPILLVLGFAVPIPCLLKYYIEFSSPIVGFFTICIVVVLCNSVSILFLGMSKHEREFLCNAVLKKLKVKK